MLARNLALAGLLAISFLAADGLLDAAGAEPVFTGGALAACQQVQHFVTTCASQDCAKITTMLFEVACLPLRP